MSDTDIDSIVQPSMTRIEKIMDMVQHMNTKYIRQIMMMLSKPNITPDHVLTNYGITLGEFCTAYVIRNKTKRAKALRK